MTNAVSVARSTIEAAQGAINGTGGQKVSFQIQLV